MSILITGGAGYIGGHMALALHDRGVRAVILDDLSNGVAWSAPPSIPLVVGSCGDYRLVSRVMREHAVTTVLHFAATLIRPELHDQPLEYYRINVANSATLLQAAADAGVRRFIYSGSASVYGQPEVNPVAETAPTAPTSPYGRSKLITEWMLRDSAHSTGMSYAVLRYFNVAGADPEARYGQSSTATTLLVQIVAQCALGVREGLQIFGTDYPTPDGTCIRDYIHVTDLIDAHLAALDHLERGGESLTVNVGYGHGYSVRDIIETTRRVTGRDFPVRVGPRREGDPIEVVAVAERVREALGWRPRFDDIETIVRHAVAWEEKLQARRALLAQ